MKIVKRVTEYFSVAENKKIQNSPFYIKKITPEPLLTHGYLWQISRHQDSELLLKMVYFTLGGWGQPGEGSAVYNTCCYTIKFITWLAHDSWLQLPRTLRNLVAVLDLCHLSPCLANIKPTLRRSNDSLNGTQRLCSCIRRCQMS